MQSRAREGGSDSQDVPLRVLDGLQLPQDVRERPLGVRRRVRVLRRDDAHHQENHHEGHDDVEAVEEVRADGDVVREPVEWGRT